MEKLLETHETRGPRFGRLALLKGEESEGCGSASRM